MTPRFSNLKITEKLYVETSLNIGHCLPFQTNFPTGNNTHQIIKLISLKKGFIKIATSELKLKPHILFQTEIRLNQFLFVIVHFIISFCDINTTFEEGGLVFV